VKKIAFITGATSGIGRASAIALAAAGYRVIGCGRRTERLQELADVIGTSDFFPLKFDVRDREAVAASVQSLPAEWREIHLLLNNAGNAHGLSNIQGGSLDDWDAMIDSNVKGLLYVTHAVLPLIPKHAGAHIINLGSLAGKEVYPNGNVYCASKFAVDALSRSMRLDLLPDGIKVSEINPGLVETEFSEVRFKGDTERAAKTYQGLQPLTPQDIAELIVFVATRPAHVNIADVIITPTAQASTTLVDKKL
jgi:3-hydroxy acid dehydrogenase/malonic semialdehyde reductase